MQIQNLKDCPQIFAEYSITNVTWYQGNVSPVKVSPALCILFQMFYTFQRHFYSYFYLVDFQYKVQTCSTEYHSRFSWQKFLQPGRQELRLKILSMWQWKMGIWDFKITLIVHQTGILLSSSPIQNNTWKKQVTLTTIHNVAA